jgi:hypothetical protein
MREPKEKHEPREKSYQKVVLSMRFLGLQPVYIPGTPKWAR